MQQKKKKRKNFSLLVSLFFTPHFQKTLVQVTVGGVDAVGGVFFLVTALRHPAGLSYMTSEGSSSGSSSSRSGRSGGAAEAEERQQWEKEKRSELRRLPRVSGLCSRGQRQPEAACQSPSSGWRGAGRTACYWRTDSTEQLDDKTARKHNEWQPHRFRNPLQSRVSLVSFYKLFYSEVSCT